MTHSGSLISARGSPRGAQWLPLLRVDAWHSLPAWGSEGGYGSRASPAPPLCLLLLGSPTGRCPLRHQGGGSECRDGIHAGGGSMLLHLWLLLASCWVWVPGRIQEGAKKSWIRDGPIGSEMVPGRIREGTKKSRIRDGPCLDPRRSLYL